MRFTICYQMRLLRALTLRQSKQTGQAIFVVMRFSVLIKTNPPEKSSILKGDGFQQKFSLKVSFICKRMVRPASFDFWKAPSVGSVLNFQYFKKYKKQIKNNVSFFLSFLLKDLNPLKYYVHLLWEWKTGRYQTRPLQHRPDTTNTGDRSVAG